MQQEAEKYRGYARECMRQATTAESSEHQRRLTELAQVWLQAALVEDGVAARSGSSA
jgi:hypothetical protein